MDHRFNHVISLWQKVSNTNAASPQISLSDQVGSGYASGMEPHQFIKKWTNSNLKESASAQSHFNDLCDLLSIEKPADADPNGIWFTFEKGAKKTGGGDGWADVWRRGAFAWEYKGKNKDLDRALAQLLQYSSALENPPLLIVSDMFHIRIHTNWTNTVQQVHAFTISDLADAKTRDLLQNAFLEPEALKPTKTRQALTEDAAEEFVQLAQRLRDRGHEPHVVAHFINRLVFCMFAEDVRLLPEYMFSKMLTASKIRPERFEGNAQKLFRAMASGGDIDFTPISWFNGGLFEDDTSLPLNREDIDNLITAADLDWSEIDPSILGTLFERGLDPSKRSQLGAHYTDRDKIMQIVQPVVIAPLEAEWIGIRAMIDHQMAKVTEAKARIPEKQSDARKVYNAARRAEELAYRNAQELHGAFIDRLRSFRVLDPACGSGNFLYLSLLSLKDIEHRANLDAEMLGLGRPAPAVGPECVLGIELNGYAAELARVSVWIGEIQWMRRNGFDAAKNPILRNLDTIQNRDAILNADGSRAKWPKADVVVGNPPFLGDKRMKSVLGADYTAQLRSAYSKDLAGRSDLVCYWFANALRAISSGKLQRVGLVSTNSIRQSSNRGILERISTKSEIFAAWADEPWVVDGASVRVSLVCFGTGAGDVKKLNGKTIEIIHADLTGGEGTSNMSAIKALANNRGIAFQGIKRVGQFEIPRDQAVEWIKAPLNPNGRSNFDVLKPWASGFDVVRRPQDFWIVDFGWDTPKKQAALYELPFKHLDSIVRPERHGKREARANEMWWIYYWPRPDLRKRLQQIRRYAARPSVAKHHIFRWFHSSIIPDGALAVIAKDDDVTFGIVQSHFHKVWALSRGSTLEDRPAYTPSTTFETFPFPVGLTPDIDPSVYRRNGAAMKIAKAAKQLDGWREDWLNPANLVRRKKEIVDGLPDRLIPVDDAAAVALKKRTLTNLYNDNPAWLQEAHAELDEAVAEAYGWGDDWRSGILDDSEIVRRLFVLNQSND